MYRTLRVKGKCAYSYVEHFINVVLGGNMYALTESSSRLNVT